MPTKKELLKEKNIEQLKEMAKDKNLEGYSELQKPELIDLLADNYRLEEIRAWPMLGIEKIESVEKSGRKGKRLGREDVKFDDMDVDRERKNTEIDTVFALAIFGAAVAVFLAILFLYLGAH